MDQMLPLSPSPLTDRVRLEIIFDSKDVAINMSHPITNQRQKNHVVKALLAAMNAIIDTPIPVIVPAGVIPGQNGRGGN